MRGFRKESELKGTESGTDLRGGWHRPPPLWRPKETSQIEENVFECKGGTAWLASRTDGLAPGPAWIRVLLSGGREQGASSSPSKHKVRGVLSG